MFGALLMSALALGGCSMSIADLPLVGTPADAPGRPKEAGSYLPVEDLPPPRDDAAIAPDEQARIKAELLAARDRQASAARRQGSGQPGLSNLEVARFPARTAGRSPLGLKTRSKLAPTGVRAKTIPPANQVDGIGLVPEFALNH